MGALAAPSEKTISFYQSEDGTTPPTRTVKIAATQGVWMPGAIGYVSESGTFKLADAATDAGSAYHGFILGTITSEASANTEFRMSVIRSQDIYAVQLENDGTLVVEAQAYVGNDYIIDRSIVAGSIGFCTVDVNGTSNTAITVVDLMSNLDPEKFNTSDTPGYALVKFLPAVITRNHA
jgi:hypothetical protein